jgi:agmatinase
MQKPKASKQTAKAQPSKSSAGKASAHAPESTYFGLPEQYSSQKNSRAVVVPCPYEATTSYGKGTKNGPKAILEASQQVELFDDELWTEPHKIGIHTHKEVKMAAVTGKTEQPFHALYEAVKPLVEFGKFPIVLGGEHSLTLGAVRACAERYPDLSVLQVDAHADCRKSYEGNPYSHASVSYHIYKNLPQPLITQVGIRNISSEEVEWMEGEKPNINIFWARQQKSWNFQDIVNTLSDNVYLTIDVDGLDGSVMPSTGTPEPGGMNWYQLMELIKVLCVRKNVVAADIVELSPLKGLNAPDFLCAKLLYKIIGYRFALDLGVTKKY